LLLACRCTLGTVILLASLVKNPKQKQAHVLVCAPAYACGVFIMLAHCTSLMAEVPLSVSRSMNTCSITAAAAAAAFNDDEG
jgi:hypothetical protein